MFIMGHLIVLFFKKFEFIFSFVEFYLQICSTYKLGIYTLHLHFIIPSLIKPIIILSLILLIPQSFAAFINCCI